VFLCIIFNVFYKQGEEEPEIRAGPVDALIVHATAAGRKGTPPTL
jgi:hypothetical protein